MLPIGTSDKPFVDDVKLFCPKCGELYAVPSGAAGAYLDGAFFGTTFPHLLLLSMTALQPTERYAPHIFGFALSKLRAPVGRTLEPQRRFCAYDEADADAAEF